MSRCARCDQEVTSGYVLCRRCYERMEGIKEAAIMQEEYQHLVERLRNRSLYKDKATLEIMDLCMEAATVITDLLARTEAAEARAEKAERERDAAVSDLLRAEEAAEETNALLDDEVHPACDYSLYLAVHDSVSDIVNWEHDDVWRSHVDEFVDCVKDMASRLASIENILGDDYDLDRLKELVEADREGRCVVLPCKIGDTIYDIQMGKITEKTIISIPFLLSKSVNHLCLHAINIRNATTTINTENLGKTVFLTRKEAEDALEKMKERDKQ